MLSLLPKIRIVYDNTAVLPRLKPEWGFSALIEVNGKKIIFDTGGDKEVFAHNLEVLGINPDEIDYIFISHEHWDHIGGLPLFAGSRAELIETPSFRSVSQGVYSTGLLGGELKEQSLILDTKRGLIVVTGCSHSGIVNIVKKAKELLNKNIYCVIGGFHLYEIGSEETSRIVMELKNNDIAKIAPCHCTGDKAISLFAKIFKKDFIGVGAGAMIDFNEI